MPTVIMRHRTAAILSVTVVVLALLMFFVTEGIRSLGFRELTVENCATAPQNQLERSS